ncbi:MAG: hypothetical protein KDE50_08650 [Caldilineaceae bacterium]|nr:hypothetical protein [Caldilineaceae bacterium]
MSDQIASGAEDKSGKIAQMFVSAKVTIPKTFQYQVDRPRLYHQLDGWQTVRGIIVHAAAGYGKSTLASGWLASSECRAQTAWLLLDQYDSEPANLSAPSPPLLIWSCLVWRRWHLRC